MKDYCLSLAASQASIDQRSNVMREYVQAYLLNVLYEAGFFRNSAFVGGTALRFLYGLPRFSEDLDFSASGKEKMKFSELMRKLMRELKLAGYTATAVIKEDKTVQNAFVKFEGLLFEAGISPLKSQKLSVKIEIDANPPRGAVLEEKLVNKFFPINFLTYDKPSLFAGKAHALLSRKYTKGRDFFDLVWYLLAWKGLEPNFVMLNNALRQTGWEGEALSPGNWRMFIEKVVEKTDWKTVKSDVARFLDRPGDANIFNKENILKLLKE